MSETHDSPELELWFGRLLRYRNGHAFEKPLGIRFPSLFWQWQQYPDGTVEVDGRVQAPPLSETTESFEVEEPYRIGRGRIFRLWPTRHAVVLGWWQHRQQHPTENEVLEQALESQLLPVTVEQIAEWGAPAEPTDDSEVMPDTVMVDDAEHGRIHREP